MDEVDTGVDTSGYSNMIDILKSKAKNCLIIMVSHRNNDAQDIFWDYKLHVNNNTVNFLETKEGVDKSFKNCRFMAGKTWFTKNIE